SPVKSEPPEEIVYPRLARGDNRFGAPPAIRYSLAWVPPVPSRFLSSPVGRRRSTPAARDMDGRARKLYLPRTTMSPSPLLLPASVKSCSMLPQRTRE